MHTNEIEVLKPGPGLTLAEIPETAAAVAEIETAHATLAAAYKATLQMVNERRLRQEIGVNAPVLEVADWRDFQAGPLRTFHAIRGKTAVHLLLLFDERLAIEAAGVREREAGIGRGLGKLMGDERAGADLALLLMRLTGGLLLDDGQLRLTRNAWDRLGRESTRQLCGLPKPPDPRPATANENTQALKKLLTEKDGDK